MFKIKLDLKKVEGPKRKETMEQVILFLFRSGVNFKFENFSIEVDDDFSVEYTISKLSSKFPVRILSEVTE